MVGVFKRESKVVAYEKRAGEDLEEVLGLLVEGFVVLVEGCGFRAVSLLFSLLSMILYPFFLLLDMSIWIRADLFFSSKMRLTRRDRGGGVYFRRG